MRSRRPFQVGFTYAATLVPVLKKCSTDLSRENIMKQAAMARSGLREPIQVRAELG